MTDLGHELSADTRHPDWMVQTVFDPDGDGFDFSYTIGLHERGLPELHVWGRPPLGDDPGVDWLLSMDDRCQLLNQVAWRLIDGEVRVGSEWEEVYDAGLTRVRLRLDAPGDRNALEAFGIAPDALVLPLRWSLHRASVARPQSLSARGRRQAEDDYDIACSELVTPFGLPRGWRMPKGRPGFSPTQRFGPLTPVVTARAAQLAQMSAADLVDLIDLAAVVDMFGSVSYPTSVARAMARSVGRTDAIDRVQRESERLIASLMQRPAWRSRWRAVERDWLDRDSEPDVRRRVPDNLRHLLGQVVLATLTSEVVADALTDDQLLAARGPWLHAIRGIGELPGSAWRAPDDVIEVVRAWVLGLDAVGLWRLGVLQEVTESADNAAFAHVVLRLHALSLTSAAGCPWSDCLDQHPVVRRIAEEMCARSDVRAEDVELIVAPIPQIQQSASLVTAALTHAGRLSHAEVAVLVQRAGSFLPDLEAEIRRRRETMA